MSRHYYNPGKFLSEWFPEQTKTIPRIIVWTIIFIGDVVLVFWLMSHLGVDILSFQYKLQGVMIMLYLVAALVVFWLETVIYNKLYSLFR